MTTFRSQNNTWVVHYYPEASSTWVTAAILTVNMTSFYVRRGGQFCLSSVANLLQYVCAKKYLNIMWFDKVIVKIKGAIYLPHSVCSTECHLKALRQKSLSIK